jgi:cytochrome c551/c552
MAAFLVRALNLPAGTPGVFTDDDGSVFEANTEALAESGITKGCNPPVNDHYCPKAYVTRGQMAAFLVRALGYTAGAGSDRFTDDDGSIFEVDIERLAEAAVTKGCNPPVNDHYCPDDYVTRGQMAAFLHRALPTTPEEPDPLIAAGIAAASQYGCVSCHTTDGSDWVGPSWKGLSERGDAAYVRQSILDPNAVIVDGYVADVMPANYGTLLSQDDLDALVAYLLSL